MAALSAILAIASPIDKSYPLDTTNTPTPAVNARDDPVPKNGWMEWYLNGVDGAVQTQGWTSDTCRRYIQQMKIRTRGIETDPIHYRARA